jgi:predicted RND superfamily exporter protein
MEKGFNNLFRFIYTFGTSICIGLRNWLFSLFSYIAGFILNKKVEILLALSTLILPILIILHQLTRKP